MEDFKKSFYESKYRKNWKDKQKRIHVLFRFLGHNNFGTKIQLNFQ
jgi:hypothetical protein